MTDGQNDDPLTKHTARLSISTADGESAREQVRELLNGEAGSRRGSVISFTSINENEEMDGNTIYKDELMTQTTRQKRRRSSVQSFTNTSNSSSSSNLTKPAAKREKIHKKKLRKASQPPELELISKDELSEKRFPIVKLRDFILNVFNVANPGKKKEQWFKLNNRNQIPKVVFCLVPGLDVEKLKSEESEKSSQFVSINSLEKVDGLNFIYDHFDTLIPSINPGSKDSIYPPLKSITNIPLTKGEKTELLKKSKETKITIYDLLLNEKDMVDHSYPIHVDVEATSGWVQTKPFEHEGSTIFALDCEFCTAASGKVLTRVSIVNFQGEVVLDTYVKPDEEIIDYVTKYSGITAEKLQDVTTTLQDIQAKIVETISASDILIGHSLESDLNVMQIKHNQIVDTSLTYQHVRGPPLKPSLKWLASTYLNRTIQAGENTGVGHSSVEDATACLDLIKLKIQEGKLFGMNAGEQSIFQKLAECGNNGNENYSKFNSLLINYSQYKEQETYQEPESHNVTNVYVTNDDEVVEQFEKDQEDKRFIVLNMRELEFALKWSSVPKHYTGRIYEDELNIGEVYERVNSRLQRIYDALPDNSMMIVHSTTGDPQNMYQLQAIRRNFQKLEKEGVDVTKLPKGESWDIEKQQLLMEATELARDAISFIGLKVPKQDSREPSVEQSSD